MNDNPQDKAAPEEPKFDAGALLRQKRMNRGQSLEAVYQQTRIPKKFLEAMETNKSDAFPAGVYLRGFLKSYCDYLEVDFDPIWRQVAPPPPTPEGAGGGPQASCAASAPSNPSAYSQAAVGRDAWPDSRREPAGRPARAVMLPLTESTVIPILFFAGLILATVTIWLLREPPAQPTHRRAAHPSPSGPPPIAPLAPPTEPSLKLTALKDAWIRLKVDGVLRFEGRVPAGNTQDWKAKKGFSLRASEPGDLRVLLDDKEIPLRERLKDPDGFVPLAR